MGCTTCGGGRAARTPGGTAKNPILLGAKDNRPPQVVTFLVDMEHAKRGAYRYVEGDGVEAAIEDGTAIRGYAPSAALNTNGRAKAEAAQPPQFYVKIGRNRWVGFKSESAAQRYAKAQGGVVENHADIIGENE